MQTNGSSNLSDVCVQDKFPVLLKYKDTRLLACFPSKRVFASHLCLSICSWTALCCSVPSWARAACSCSLLCSTCSWSCMLRLRSCTLCALMFACSALSCWILDSSFGKGNQGYSLNFKNTRQQYSDACLFLFAQGVLQILIPDLQHLLEFPSLFLPDAFLQFNINGSNAVKNIGFVHGPKP